MDPVFIESVKPHQSVQIYDQILKNSFLMGAVHMEHFKVASYIQVLFDVFPKEKISFSSFLIKTCCSQ